MWAKKKNAAFTIVELLIVIVVIGILAALVISTFSGVQARARDADRSSDVNALKKALEAYKIDNGTYPAVCSADNAGCSTNDLASSLVPKYINAIPLDPQAPSVGYSYVRGTVASDSYAIYIPYEAKSPCKSGTNVNTGWWGIGAAVC